MTGTQPVYHKIRSMLSGQQALAFLLPVIFFFLILSPLLGLGMDLLLALYQGTIDLSSSLLLSSRRLGLLVASIGFAAAVAASGIVTGILLVSALWKTSRNLLFSVLFALLAIAAIPPYIHALTWSALAGYLAGFLPGVPVSGWGISYWVEFMALLPIATLLVWVAFASVDPALVEAGRVFRTDMVVFTRILLPLSAPALGAAFGLLFLLCCSDYSIPSLFGADVYSLDIFAQFSMSASAAQAFLYAIPLMLVTIVVMLACLSGIRNLAQTPDWLSARFNVPPRFPRPFVLLQYLTFGMIAIQVLILFSGLVIATGSYNTFIHSVSIAQDRTGLQPDNCRCSHTYFPATGTGRSPRTEKAGPSGSNCLDPRPPSACDTWFPGWYRNGYILECSRCFRRLSGSFPASIGWNRTVCSCCRHHFICSLRFIDPILFDAADVFSFSIMRNWTEIRLPLLTPGLFVAAGILVCLTLGELGGTLVVAPPGHATLTMRIYNYLHYGASGEVAGLCLMITILTLIVSIGTITAVVFLYKNAGHNRKRGV